MRLFRIVMQALAMLALAALLLAGIEVILRLAGQGRSIRVFTREHLGGTDYHVTNGAFFQQFFALPIDTMWQDAETYIPCKKPENSIRIVILGESAALGVPPDFAFSFGRILEAMLEAQFPKARFDLYILAQPGINSYALREIARDCRRIQPDFLAVYMGNNEINGPFGALATPRDSFLSSLYAIRVRFFLRDLRLVQLLTAHGRVPWHAPPENPEQIASPDDPRMERSSRHFRSNLQDIIRAGRDAGAHVLLCTVGCNQRQWPPQTSTNRTDLPPERFQQWQDNYSAGIASQSREQWDEAARAYRAAEAIDSTHAELQFRLGQCLLALGQTGEAAVHFKSAWNLDGFHSRVMPRMNEIVREEAAAWASERVHLLDMARVLANESPGGIPGSEFFYDNVHLTFPGNYVIARELFVQIAALLPSSARGEIQGGPIPPAMSECEQRLGLSPGVLLKHLRGVVMGYRMWWKRPTPELDQQITALEAALGPDILPGITEGYRKALEYRKNDRLLRTRYAETLLEGGRTEEAIQQARVLAEQYPYRPATHRLLGAALTQAGQTEEALRELETALSLCDADAKTQYERGRLLEKLERFSEAKDAYIAAILINPRNFESYDPLNALFEKEGGAAARAKGWAALVNQVPDSARAHFQLGLALESVNDLPNAIEHYRTACGLEGFDPAMQGALGHALLKSGKWLEAVPPLQQALQINPDIAHFRPLLLRALIKCGKLDEARAEAERCRDRGIALPPEVQQEWDAVSGISK
ncbi:MAG TPA: tetratricopeptide repeat protein [Candidatus Hydrogenedentes bacterium]|nr:tetratricopeptide repeat protein [Candidatus Hydrogenedentota bacterium]HRT18572.1 tetratricopeptide repeat protein [Candidatus Hydrogenedentota bacterium]HRT63591.1 tetratricopeptide repeat protein [Candidatus Hydrogenedentota bacterium]